MLQNGWAGIDAIVRKVGECRTGERTSGSHHARRPEPNKVIARVQGSGSNGWFMLVNGAAPCHPLTVLLYSKLPVYKPKLRRTRTFAVRNE